MTPSLLRELADLAFVEATSAPGLTPSDREHLYAIAQDIDARADRESTRALMDTLADAEDASDFSRVVETWDPGPLPEGWQ